MKKWFLALASVFAALSHGTLHAEPITREQGDAILTELREIRQLLAKPQQQQAPSAAPAAAQTVTIKADAKYVLGRSDAPLTLIEFTDYQCPFCERFETNTLPEIKKKFIDTGRLRLVLRDLPLDMHPFALPAAQSVRCAGDQGRFWDMKQLVFRNQSRLDQAALAGYAKELGLDADAFQSCMTSGKHMADIKEDARYAQSLGISGTPSFVLAKTSDGAMVGQMIVGAQSYSFFETAINNLLAK
jgi:protein-disulfide isomerase